jgi:hypothetical protein
MVLSHLLLWKGRPKSPQRPRLAKRQQVRRGHGPVSHEPGRGCGNILAFLVKHWGKTPDSPSQGPEPVHLIHLVKGLMIG